MIEYEKIIEYEIRINREIRVMRWKDILKKINENE